MTPSEPKRPRRTPRLVPLVALGAALAAALGYAACLRDLQSLRAPLEGDSHVVDTPSGPVEFAEGGRGPAVLVIHGAGGGHDQGRLLAEAFLPDSYRWIAPSRFGYLRSPLPADASTEAQADALAALLDVLGERRIAVLAMSGGVPPALQLATRHPDRVSALVLLSLAPFWPLTAADQDLPVPIWLYDALFRTDFPYWLAWRVAPGRLQPIFDVRPELRGAMTPRERVFVERMVGAFLPVSARAAGLRNEAAAIDPAAANPLPGVHARTLIVHARDDRITPFSTAEFAAARIPRVEFLPLPSGGHLLLGHHAAVAASIAAFLQEPPT
ncbi:MAG: alpha/beta hydrolase [Steroidobacteraceae bacterium]|jgi:pimeloyl-ACP methyl ester carboxylesterase|nr:alpha/beta hydrolase [Steroidobacteraceae bacterium]